ncbi:hypothetical protein [Sulfuriroseicoccus oceanibius]|uniref:Uncharacterized protein n=1 Tax=Sulfuriroseicoccus oceanibius TaxID=2707525 RepID=A0A6B3LB50_9BACT|nr:hypothetical protein [Sulfuriroseicoccus oceanibius]QQL45496.1 hypothetical protein G3M56_002590 [Sulfuriroseicoccus oceanibius]
MKQVHLIAFVLAVSFTGLPEAQARSKSKAQLQKQTIVARAKQLDRSGPGRDGPEFNLPNKGRSMFKGMKVLSDGQRWTLVPALSILALPETHAYRIPEKATGTYVSWPEFLRHNRAWLRNYPVSVNTIKGTTPLTGPQRDHLAKAQLVAIATYNNNPVSVLPPRAKESDEK